MTKSDTIADPEFNPYAADQLADLDDEQLLQLRADVAAELAVRSERCKRLLQEMAPKRTRKSEKK